MTRARAASAGAAAALVWGAVEPLDIRLFRNDYSDVAMLGKLVTRGRAWPLAGVALHALNGATFGLALHAVARRSRRGASEVALGLALGESVVLFPLAYVVDRHHPARGERGLAPLFTPRGFAQATFRHTLFGAALAGLLR